MKYMLIYLLIMGLFISYYHKAFADCTYHYSCANDSGECTHGGTFPICGEVGMILCGYAHHPGCSIDYGLSTDKGSLTIIKKDGKVIITTTEDVMNAICEEIEKLQSSHK